MEETPQSEPETPAATESGKVKSINTSARTAAFAGKKTVTASESLFESPKTGDSGSLPWVLSALVSAAGILGLGKKKRK